MPVKLKKSKTGKVQYYTGDLEVVKSDFDTVKIPFDNKIKRKIKQLEADKNFQHIVLTFRKKVGIPVKGLNPKDTKAYDEYSKLHTDLESKVEASIERYNCLKQIMGDFGLGYGFFMPLQDYLYYGEHIPIGAVDGNYRHGCSLEYTDQGVRIVLYPEVTQGDIKNLVKLKWKEIESALAYYHPIKHKTPRLKKSTQEEMHAFVYQLFLIGLFKKDGSVNSRVETSVLKEEGFGNLKELFSSRGYKKPGVDQRKNIIAAQARLNRIQI